MSKKWSYAGILALLEETAELRRSWIREESPSVSEVLEKFPCFTDPRIVSIDNCTQTVSMCVFAYTDVKRVLFTHWV